MLLTLNQVISQITTLAAAHSQIQASGVGDFAEWQAEERNYPLLWVFHETTSVGNRELIYSIRLICADRVITGQEGDDTDGMEQEVLSDTMLILLDFLSYFMQQHTQSYTVVPSATIDPFTERFNDRVAGNSVVIQIRQPFTWNSCQIPQTGATIPPTVDGITLYDFCDPSVIARLTPAQVVCLEAEYGIPCADGNIELNGVPFDTVPSGGTLDIPVIDTGSNPVGSQSGADWVIGNNATYINTVQVTDQAAEQDAFIAVELDGNPSGTWNAGTQTWEVTSNPCLDGNIELNGAQVATVASGGTEDIDVVNGGSNQVGAWDGSSWVIGNNYTEINGVQVTDQEAEVNAAIFVTRDGVQNGAWNAGTQTWEVTSAACSPVTFQINAVNKESLSSGSTFNLITLLDGVVNSGSYDAPTDTLSFTSAVPTAKTTAFPLKTGETFNYGTGSDGQVQSGSLVSWLVMSENNMFGNTNRFTDTLGGSTYANNIVLDHQSRDPLTGNLLGYDKADVVTARTFAAHLTYFATKTNSGYGNWRGTNYNELHQISRWGGINFKWNFAPFNYSGAGTADYLWVTTTNNIATADAWLIFNYSTVPVQSRAKAGSYFMMGCRTFNLTDSGVLT